MKLIELDHYLALMETLRESLELVTECLDCIVCIKRSGFILGAYLSNQLGLPLYTQSEISKIPSKDKNVLVVDDKTDKGKAMRKTYKRLLKYGKMPYTATLIQQGDYDTVFFVERTNGEKVKMWYENIKK